jgi:hypothetical protein
MGETHTMSVSRRLAASKLILEARNKDFEAACWMGFQKQIEETRAQVASATDAVLDATMALIDAVRAEARDRQ